MTEPSEKAQDLAIGVLECEIEEYEGRDICEVHQDDWPCSDVITAARLIDAALAEAWDEGAKWGIGANPIPNPYRERS